MATIEAPVPTRRRETLEQALIRFCGDSGDAMQITRAALKDVGLDAKSMDRCKNFFALGMCYWLYNRSMDTTSRYLEDKFKNKPEIIEANKLAMKAGHVYCEVTEAFQVSYEIPKAK